MTRRARGFTLVEVLIAVAITAVVGAMALGAFARSAAARQAVEEQDERIGGARAALTRMSRDVTGAFVSDHFDRARFRDRPTVFTGRDGGDRDTLRFATMAHVRGIRDARESDQSVVEYSVDSDPEIPGGYALFRREKTRIDDDPERGGVRQLLLHNVVGFDVEYWDWQRQEWAREWSTAPGERLLLPPRVKMKLTMRMPDGKTRSLETQAKVAIIRPLDF